MTPWLILLVGLVLMAGSLWQFRRSLLREMRAALDAMAQQCRLVEQNVQAAVERVDEARRVFEEAPTPAPLWLGAFLPTDEQSAALERQILSSEDRAISDTGISVPSRRPSRRSVGRSPRAVLTRPASSSGSGS
jgi:hypothetical protein